MLRYASLFSGSSGNCIYIGDRDGGFLVDTGVTAKRVEIALRDREIDPRRIHAVLVTHEHDDHIKGLAILCKRYGWPVLASVGTLDALLDKKLFSAEYPLYVMQAGKPSAVADWQILPFSSPHDSRECLGYRLDGPDGRSAAVATDIGVMTQEILDSVAGCQLIHIESNHDVPMLLNGPYPPYLISRIRGKKGHLSNDECAAVLPGLAQTGTQRFVLGHLSQHNNTPQLASETAVRSLSAAGCAVGRDCLLSVAEPIGTQPLTYF